MGYKSFETERLVIRPTTTDDAEFIFVLVNTPKWLKYIGDRNVKSITAAEAYIKQKMTPQLKRLGYSNYTVLQKENGQKIGTCGLYDREGLDGIDVGFAFIPAYEGKGFAFEAASRIRDAAFHEFKIASLCAITTSDNTSSQKLLEKLGLHCKGTTKLPKDTEELLLYAVKK